MTENTFKLPRRKIKYFRYCEDCGVPIRSISFLRRKEDCKVLKCQGCMRKFWRKEQALIPLITCKMSKIERKIVMVAAGMPNGVSKSKLKSEIGCSFSGLRFALERLISKKIMVKNVVNHTVVYYKFIFKSNEENR